MIPAGENVTGAMGALSNTVDDMKVVYLITTAKPTQPPAPEVTKTTAYLFDLKSNQPLATKELQPPTPDLKLTAANEWRLSPTRSGVALLNAFTDGHGAVAAPGPWCCPIPTCRWRGTIPKLAGFGRMSLRRTEYHGRQDVARSGAAIADG